MPGRALRLVLHPAPWLLAQGAALLWFLGRRGLLEPFRLVDTWSYEQTFEAESLTELLSWGRTLGYPLFLASVGRLAEGYALVPEAQALVHIAAALLFAWSVSVYTGSGWLGFAAATPVLWGRHLSMVHGLQSDLLAADLATASAAFLLLVVERPRRRVYWVGLVLSVLATYQVRPAYLFLLVLVPLLGIVLGRLRRSPAGVSRRGLGWGLLAAVLVPFVLYCGLRWIVVGHFGLVSFGGVNLIGVTANFVDEDLVEELSERHRPLAAAILRGRDALGLAPHATEPGGSWRAIQVYNGNIHEVAYPAAVRLLEQQRAQEMRRQIRRQRKAARQERRRSEREGGAGADAPDAAPSPPEPDSASSPPEESGLGEYVEHAVEANRWLSDLSREIVRRRPSHYLQWIVDNASLALAALLGYRWILWSGLALLASLPLAVLRGRAVPAGEDDRAAPIVGVFLLAVGFFAAHLLLVVAVSIPIDRYLMTGVFLLPAALLVQLVELWRRILAA